MTVKLTFGDPEPVHGTIITDYLGVFATTGGYFNPAIQLSGLAKMPKANSHHGSCLIFRRNEILKTIISSPVPFRDKLRIVQDGLTFGMFYLQRIQNGIRKTVNLKYQPAVNMRMMEDGRFCRIDKGGNKTEFKNGEIIQIILNFDGLQEIYGVPDWIGGLQGALLNQDATLFRRKYYKNGSHLGYLLYTSGVDFDDDSIKKLTEAVKNGKGAGNFQSMHIHSPNGDKDAVQLVPVGDMSRKDNFDRVKNVSSGEVLVAHRVHRALIGGMAGENSYTGDPVKLLNCYRESEVDSMIQIFEQVNEFLPRNLHFKFEIKYATGGSQK